MICKENWKNFNIISIYIVLTMASMAKHSHIVLMNNRFPQFQSTIFSGKVIVAACSKFATDTTPTINTSVVEIIIISYLDNDSINSLAHSSALSKLIGGRINCSSHNPGKLDRQTVGDIDKTQGIIVEKAEDRDSNAH